MRISHLVADRIRTLGIGLLLTLTLFWIGALLPRDASAQDIEGLEHAGPSFFENETLGGDWNGFRSALLEHGVFMELEYFGEVFHMAPRKRSGSTRYFGIVNMEFHIDPERLFNGPEGHLYFFATLQHGSRFQPFIGSVHDLSNIEARSNLLLMQAWYDQYFLNRRLSVLFGIYDIANEFDYRDSAQLFLNGSFGTGVDLTESGTVGVPTYPLTTLALRIRVDPTPNWYFLAAVLDGVPGNPRNPKGTQIILDADDEGALFMSEVGYQSHQARVGLNKAGIGSWWYTKEFPDLTERDASGKPRMHAGTQGLYLFAEGTLYQEYENSKQGLDSFVRLGFSDKDVNSLATYFDAGLVYTGLIPGRNRDKAGIGVSYLFFANKFKQQQRAQGLSIDHPEVLIEATYRIEMRPGMFLQPDLNYIFNPVARRGATDTLSVGLRFGLNF